jgi:3-oxoacyl-[acyl-carrier-protein] synthase-1
VTTKERIFLSPPALLCCAGSDRFGFFEAAIRGDQTGIKPLSIATGNKLTLKPEPNIKQSFMQFLAGRIDDGRLKQGGGPHEPAPDLRLNRIVGVALEQLRPSMEAALRRYGKNRIGTIVGSCDNGSEPSLNAHRAYVQGGAFPPDYTLALQGAQGPAEYAAAVFGLGGPVLAVATACASGATALIRGAELIRSGVCDAVLAGGADLASEIALLGFDALEAVSDSLCNPFSKNRKGINLGEGACFFLLTRERTPEGIDLQGAGESADAVHMTAPDSEGRGASSAMEAALEDAGVQSSEIAYVNLHGPGTPLNDRMEALAMERVFSSKFVNKKPLASSTKPITGHTLGAAGALELALCWMLAANPGAPAPVHCWDGQADEDMPALNFALPGSRPNPGVYMSNSFAFGGCNVSLILGRG